MYNARFFNDGLFGVVYWSSALLLFAWWKKLNFQTQAIIMCLEHLCLWVFASIVPIFLSYYAISKSSGASALAFSHLSCMHVCLLLISLFFTPLTYTKFSTIKSLVSNLINLLVMVFHLSWIYPVHVHHWSCPLLTLYITDPSSHNTLSVLPMLRLSLSAPVYYRGISSQPATTRSTYHVLHIFSPAQVNNHQMRQ